MNIEKITPQIAALYFGQKCEITEVPAWYHRTLNPTHKVGEIKTLGMGLLHGIFDPNGLAFTLHLRRLESITEEEVKEAFFAFCGQQYDDIYTDNDAKWSWWMEYEEWHSELRKLAIGDPRVWLYLISKGFDLFGLIDKGLAKEIKS